MPPDDKTDGGPVSPFITAAFAERDERAARGDVSPFREWTPQPDMLPDYDHIPGYGPETGQIRGRQNGKSRLYDLDTGHDLSNPRIQDLDDQ